MTVARAHLPAVAVEDGAPAERRAAPNCNRASALRDKCVHVWTASMTTAVWIPCATNAQSTGGECGGARTSVPALLLMMVHPMSVADPNPASPIVSAPFSCVANECT